jgi:prevent-host-death family protein
MTMTMEGPGMKSKRQRTIPAGEFKAKCLQLMEEVKRDGIELVITKRGQPIAKLVPAEPPKEVELFGYMRGTAITHGDIVSPDTEDWGDLA